MPTYVYELLDKKGEPTGESFEIVQAMREDALTRQPGTGLACRRAIVAPAIAGKHSPIKEKSIIDVILQNFQGTFGWVNKIGK